MGQFVKLPGFVLLENYMTLEVLSALELLAWLSVDEDSPLKALLQEQFPEGDRNNYVDALKEIGVIAQEARIKKQGGG